MPGNLQESMFFSENKGRFYSSFMVNFHFPIFTIDLLCHLLVNLILSSFFVKRWCKSLPAYLNFHKHLVFEVISGINNPFTIHWLV